MKKYINISMIYAISLWGRNNSASGFTEKFSKGLNGLNTVYVNL